MPFVCSIAVLELPASSWSDPNTYLWSGAFLCAPISWNSSGTMAAHVYLLVYFCVHINCAPIACILIVRLQHILLYDTFL
jgi:hypothetical protein